MLSVGVEGVHSSYESVQWAIALEMNTPPLEDLQQMFHRGCQDFKWSSPMTAVVASY